MSVAIVSILLLEIGDFEIRIKQKTLSYISGHFSGQTLQIYVFFFTMQRSNKNIISSKINIFLKIQINWRKLFEEGSTKNK